LHFAAAAKAYVNKKLSDHINMVNSASSMMQAAIQGKGTLLRSAGEGMMGHIAQLKAGVGKGGLRDAAKAEMADQVSVASDLDWCHGEVTIVCGPAVLHTLCLPYGCMGVTSRKHLSDQTTNTTAVLAVCKH
jgi:hypothetical protein